MKNWLRVKEAQEYCGVSERTIYNWIKNDGLKYSKVKGIILINRQSLDEFIENHRVPGSIQNEVEKILGKIL
ncbi:helix-turn-helix domain-containing protein [Candidatus Latescibacterota bacterium]